MRIPHTRESDCIAMMRHAFDRGINYVDTAYGYCDRQSEVIVGKALKGYRDRMMLSTKLPMWAVKSRADYRTLLDEQLRKLDTEWIDFYHFHGLDRKSFEEKVLGFDLIEEALKAREAGLIRHISFSFHDKPEVMMRIIDTGVFSSVLCQYNLLDRSNEEAIAYAHRKGLGVVVMGPVAGGKLAEPSDTIQGMIPDTAVSTPEIALRFVLANPHVSCALSGMNTRAMIQENIAIASNETPLSSAEKLQIDRALEKVRKLADLYCTGCNYCMPCPHGVNIPLNFQLMNYHRVYGLSESARQNYAQIGTVPWLEGKPASDCTECGACEEKCPQSIAIRQQLRETARELGANGS